MDAARRARAASSSLEILGQTTDRAVDSSSSRCSTASSRRAAARARRPAPTAPTLRAGAAQASSTKMIGGAIRDPKRDAVPTQCHDITRLSGDRLAGGACEGYGLLLDIQRPARTRCASAPSPIRTSPTGTRRRSTTTARRSCSPTNGAAAARRSAARPTRRSGAPTRSSRSRTAR